MIFTKKIWIRQMVKQILVKYNTFFWTEGVPVIGEV